VNGAGSRETASQIPSGPDPRQPLSYSAALSEITEKSLDFWPSSTSPKPSAARPRLSNSRIAAALLGIRFVNRQVSIIRSKRLMCY
jgi:hypothetical protein